MGKVPCYTDNEPSNETQHALTNKHCIKVSRLDWISHTFVYSVSGIFLFLYKRDEKSTLVENGIDLVCVLQTEPLRYLHLGGITERYFPVGNEGIFACLSLPCLGRMKMGFIISHM